MVIQLLLNWMWGLLYKRESMTKNLGQNPWQKRYFFFSIGIAIGSISCSIGVASNHFQKSYISTHRQKSLLPCIEER